MTPALQPALEVLALRASRVAVLQRLADLGMSRVRETGRQLETGTGAALSRLARRFCRLSYWIRLAIYLCVRIRNGALDAPRPVRAPRQPAASLRRSTEARAERETCERPPRPEPDEAIQFERCLDRPFGEVVARICRGLGVAPDWDAWADEPWAQAEPRAVLRQDGAGRPPSDPSGGPPPGRRPPRTPRLPPAGGPHGGRPPVVERPPRPRLPAASPGDPILNRKARRAQAARRRGQPPRVCSLARRPDLS